MSQDDEVFIDIGKSISTLSTHHDNSFYIYTHLIVIMKSNLYVSFILIAYHDIGDPTCICPFCGAKLWEDERVRKQRNSSSPKFYLCCGCGKTSLPKFNQPPAYIKDLFFNNSNPKRKHFLDNIRAYNTMFSFTSMGGSVGEL